MRLDEVTLLAQALPEIDEQAGEQRYLDHAYRQLEAMTDRTSAAVADAAERAAGDWDATVAHLHLTRRVASLVADSRPLCWWSQTARAPARRSRRASEFRRRR